MIPTSNLTAKNCLPQLSLEAEEKNCKILIDNKLAKFNKEKLYRITVLFCKFVMLFFLKSSGVHRFLKRKIEAHDYATFMNKYCVKFMGKKDLFSKLSHTQFQAIGLLFGKDNPDANDVFQLYDSLKYLRLQNRLEQFKNTLNQNKGKIAAGFRDLPKQLKNDLTTIVCIAFNLTESHQNVQKKIYRDPNLFINVNSRGESLVDQLSYFYQIIMSHQLDLFTLKALKEKNDPFDKSLIFDGLSKFSKAVIRKPDTNQDSLDDWIGSLEKELSNLKTKLNNCKKVKQDTVIYDTSLDSSSKDDLQDKGPLTIALASVEYANLVSQGGLAEAVEGLAQGLLKTNPQNKIRLIFPKYSILPEKIKNCLKKSDFDFVDGKKEPIAVYTANVDGIECYFIEDPNFILEETNPSIYKGNEKERFAAFSTLAADVLYQMKDLDVIHLHDWHVAGIALKLSKEHPEEWAEGKIPPTVFTFHNNNRSAQGRNMAGIYNYDPVIKALDNAGITTNNGNLFIETLDIADAVTTVSETFAKESQQPDLGEGISFAVRTAAKVGKLTGIVNGINTERWNPNKAVDNPLKDWKDPITGEILDLRFGADTESITKQKTLAKEQVGKWVQTFLNKDSKNKFKDLYSAIDNERNLSIAFHAPENEETLIFQQISGKKIITGIKPGIEQWDAHDKKFQDVALKITKNFTLSDIDRWAKSKDFEKRLIINARKSAIASRNDVDWSGLPLFTEADKAKKQSEMKLFDPNKPLILYVGRLDSYQKGLDKLEDAIKAALEIGGQFVVMGSQEDEKATKILDDLENRYSQKVLFLRDYKDSKGKYYYQQGDAAEGRPGIGFVMRAAADFCYVPSSYEPCGLVQLEAEGFGTQPIVSNTGGLADTVIPREKNPEDYNGYLFDRESKTSTGPYETVKRALKDWLALDIKEKDRLSKRILISGRKHSWSDSPKGYTPSERYQLVYRKAMDQAKMRSIKQVRGNRFDIRQVLNQTLDSDDIDSYKQSKEEHYLKEYYFGTKSHAELCALYDKMDMGLRVQLPLPYGKRINTQNYNRYGAKIEGETTLFRVFAPKAERVQIKLFDEGEQLVKAIPLSKNAAGDWEISLKNCPSGTRYQYTVDGVVKIDPYAIEQRFSAGVDKAPYSVVRSRDSFQWNDQKWLHKRATEAGSPQPMSILEVHPTAWKRDEKGNPLNYRQLADELVAHCKKEKFTHVELMGILEHPHEGSLGYQVTGFFSPNSRSGSVDDFKYLVNKLHENDINVILDWIPAHFAKDSYGLINFDNSGGLYESEKWSSMLSARHLYGWGTKFFDFGKKEVREFLISSAMYWIKELHIDGLRVDAIRNILHCEDNAAARLFLKELNTVVHAGCKGAMTYAEDYSSNANTTVSPIHNGLGFDYKWHIGWLEVLSSYFNKPVAGRNNKVLIDALEGDIFHKMVLALSHDQVKDGLKSIRCQLEGGDHDFNQANERALFSFMFCCPGKKLNFMGNESGARNELTSYIGRKEGLQNLEKPDENLLKMFKKLNSIYIDNKSLWEKDDNGSELEWITQKNLIAYRRTSSDDESIACFHNFSSDKPLEYNVETKSLPKLLFDSENPKFGGKGKLTFKILTKEGNVVGYRVVVPPLGTAIVKET